MEFTPITSLPLLTADLAILNADWVSGNTWNFTLRLVNIDLGGKITTVNKTALPINPNAYYDRIFWSPQNNSYIFIGFLNGIVVAKIGLTGKIIQQKTYSPSDFIIPTSQYPVFRGYDLNNALYYVQRGNVSEFVKFSCQPQKNIQIVNDVKFTSPYTKYPATDEPVLRLSDGTYIWAGEEAFTGETNMHFWYTTHDVNGNIISEKVFTLDAITYFNTYYVAHYVYVMAIAECGDGLVYSVQITDDGWQITPPYTTVYISTRTQRCEVRFCPDKY